MSEVLPETSKLNPKTDLAAAIAGGISVNKCAARNGVPGHTAYNCARERRLVS
jgi:hypothetical protein